MHRSLVGRFCTSCVFHVFYAPEQEPHAEDVTVGQRGQRRISVSISIPVS